MKIQLNTDGSITHEVTTYAKDKNATDFRCGGTGKTNKVIRNLAEMERTENEIQDYVQMKLDRKAAQVAKRLK